MASYKLPSKKSSRTCWWCEDVTGKPPRLKAGVFMVQRLSGSAGGRGSTATVQLEQFSDFIRHKPRGPFSTGHGRRSLNPDYISTSGSGSRHIARVQECRKTGL